MRQPCPQCGVTVNLHLWTVVDAAERPDLIEQLRLGKFDRVQSPECNRDSFLPAAPLLLYWPGKPFPLIYFPAPGPRGAPPSAPAPRSRRLESLLKSLNAVPVEEEIVRGQTVSGLAELRKRLGEQWRGEWAERLRVVPRPALRATVDALSRGKPLDDLDLALGAFLQTASRGEARRVIEAYPLLLGEEAAGRIDQEVALAGGDEMRLRKLSLLRDCRRGGVAAAFSGLARYCLMEAGCAKTPEEAIRLCREALTFLRREDDAPGWGLLQSLLGNRLLVSRQGDLGENLEHALQAHEAALQVFDPAAHRAAWAMLMDSLASIYVERVRDDRAHNIEHAIQLYDKVLGVLSWETFPSRWAWAKNNLAIAYRCRIEGNRLDNVTLAL